MKIMTGKHCVLSVAAVMLSLVVSGCQSPISMQSHPQQELPTNDLNNQTCRTDYPTASSGPDVIYTDMIACVQAQQLDKAVFLYALAGSYTWFDAKRIATQYARMAHEKRLGKALAQLTEKQHAQFWDHLRATMNDGSKKNGLCERIKATGIPTHSASYMSIDKTANSTGIPAERHQWDSAVNNYMTCNHQININADYNNVPKSVSGFS
ncbi:hypothetical protein [Yersinia kristensenii]|uniref:hypothetical protein n=1 Tax=Yersinia kristensenii TaxID=28152 RepID=UPI0005E0FA3B|nr:hypothetical protein [Yersinia kristensenii]CNF34598.1 Uncharacterised protein [Yersinia kristensenii]